MKTKIKIDYLRNQILIYLLDTQKFIKEVAKHFQDQQLNCVLGFTIENAIYLNSDNLNLGVFIHEIVHAVSYIMQHHDIQDQQSRAYLTQYIFEEFMKFIKKKNIEIK